MTFAGQAMGRSVTATRVALGVVLLVAQHAAGHVTFKLPSLPGVSPGNSGGYGANFQPERVLHLAADGVPAGPCSLADASLTHSLLPAVPFDGNYLSNSPFMLNVPHSKAGNLTIGLQCSVPVGVSATPAELPGYDLTLGINAAGAVANFTYTANPDALYPNGWLQPATNFPTANTMLSTFVAVSISATSCNFTDAANTAITSGYPTLYFPCAEVVLAASTNLSSNAQMLAAPLSVLLWTLTPGGPALPAIGGTFTLDGGNAVSGCTSWPCSNISPFGGVTATVLEANSAPGIKLIPQGCVGVNCTSVSGSILAPFPNCPGGKVTVLGNVTGNSTTASATQMSSSSPASDLSNNDIVAWLSVLTAVFSFFFIGQCLLALHTRITRATAAEPKLSPEAPAVQVLAADNAA